MTTKNYSTVEKPNLSITDFESQLVEVRDNFLNLEPEAKAEAFLLIQDLQISLSKQVCISRETSVINKDQLSIKTLKNIDTPTSRKSYRIVDENIEKTTNNYEEKLLHSHRQNDSCISPNYEKVCENASTSKNPNKNAYKASLKVYCTCKNSKKELLPNKSFCELCSGQLTLKNNISNPLIVIEDCANQEMPKRCAKDLTGDQNYKAKYIEECLNSNPKHMCLNSVSPKILNHFSMETKIGAKFECTPCSKQFLQRQHFDKHMLLVKHYKCTLCKFLFATKKDLMKHKKTIHGVLLESSKKNHPCKMCDKKFSNPSLLIAHQKAHTENRYKCTLTNKLLLMAEKPCNNKDSNLNFKNSIKNTVKKKLFLCSNCDSQFVYKQGLERHIYERHTNVDPYTCTLCEYTCRSKANLKRHVDLHLNDRRFVCDICGSTFNAHATLKSHIAYVHSEERRYNCQICGKSFKGHSALNRHLRIHKDERPYVCFCKESYKRMSHLKRHIHSVHKQKLKGRKVDKLCKLLKKSVNTGIATSDVNTTQLRTKNSQRVEKEGSSFENIKSSSEDLKVINNELYHLRQGQEVDIISSNKRSLLEGPNSLNVNVPCQLLNTEVFQSLNIPETEIQLNDEAEFHPHSMPFQIVTTEDTMLTVQYNSEQPNQQATTNSKVVAFPELVNCNADHMLKINDASNLCLSEVATSLWDPNLLITSEPAVICNDQENMDSTRMTKNSSLKHPELTFSQDSSIALRSVEITENFSPESNDLASSNLQPLNEQFYCESVNLNSLLSV